ncbi:MAG: helix-turn-helix domain-containing protein [Opitutales bacterium]
MPTIAITMDVDPRRSLEVFSGVERFLRENRLNWRLAPLGPGFEATLLQLVRAGRLDGVIGAFVSDAWTRDLAASGVAAVNISQISEIRAVPSVGIDFREIGQKAAELLLSTEPRTLAFAGVRGQFSSRRMRDGYAAGTTLDVIDAPVGADYLRAQWLRQLALPASLFCASDSLARDWILAAREAGLAVPKDLAVMGVGDSPVDALFASIALSSFALPWGAVGFQAAGTLQRLLESDPGDWPTCAEPRWVSGANFVPRASTRRGSQRDWLVDSMMASFRSDLSQPPAVEELARQAGLSRRALEMRFQEALGQGPYHVYQQLRFEHACALLRERPDLKIQEIARACGFEDPHPFSAAFKRRFGCSPRQWRAAEGA